MGKIAGIGNGPIMSLRRHYRYVGTSHLQGQLSHQLQMLLPVPGLRNEDIIGSLKNPAIGLGKSCSFPAAHGMAGNKIHILWEYGPEFFGKPVFDSRNICEHRPFLKERQVLFDKGHCSLFRSTENDNFRLFQLSRVNSIYDSHGEGLSGHTFRPVNADHRVPQFFEPFGKGAPHEAQSDDGHGNPAKVTVHNDILFYDMQRGRNHFLPRPW